MGLISLDSLPGSGKIFFSSPKKSRPTQESSQIPTQEVTEAFSVGKVAEM
jgi:hypothetical protein